jgi:hypothetical protein
METDLIIVFCVGAIVILMGIAGFAQMLHQQGVYQQKNQRTSEV